ncbi:putative disease resistance RPP13-like protein 1 [Quercus robur]|uniref:putative disease resistance RPP13-like protein 1 n=1 Tax=Quercus robur TaxID=38942 RepID=UPI0021627461|nr:putative disease resistance RPP13-like protein 1 [Quercus robur]XP_050284629.1 putative disease resistance RPP13-like protein 1 [Quercus robur]XP_050284630.1 putative disease resistance RPP13-like protein 1 [Quercus robur]XP_050284631.1 putative disease resistance RPP13-like protein 1 [Quercus robur]XP_050284632.1 putative disease resistance RPP13-like protein 1 [Quercus robur]XP_050284633.1 putative disease resistance RPP13-like protein 1 [Quercus robur]XP_050284634.1 putative disease res
MSVIGEAALSAFFEVLFDNLSSSDLLKIFQQEQVHADLKKWKTTLPKIRAVLDDAEDKQMTSKFVKSWLDDLEDLAYDVDDILDEFATEALRRKLNAEEPSTSKVRKFIPACCVGLNPSSIMFDANMRSKINEINTRLQEIVTQKNDLELRENTGRGRTGATRPRMPTTSLVNEGHTHGRVEDKKAIVKLLLSGESSNAPLSVIPILGMGGMGKTTLAQLVYNDDVVSNYFDVKAWGCVSEDFDIVKVTREILQSVTSESCNDNNLDLLQVKLKGKLSGKKFLLVLDDVWNENYNDWTRLRCPFEFGAPGSKIIITTRSDRFSSTMGTTQAYKLKELPDDACLIVFIQNTLGTTDFSAYPELQEFGPKILERCQGLPLAAKTLAGLLRTMHYDEWKNVLNNKIWDMSEENSDVLPTLRLSYLYLPSHLKRCFAYCSLFPKDYEFEEQELVLLWMAEGLVQESEKHKPMEALGVEYFCDLYKRSLFQQSSRNRSLFVMHDLINDLAQWAAGQLCHWLEDKSSGNMQPKISTKVRHFSYARCAYDGITKFKGLTKDMHLRTFLPLPTKDWSYLTNYVFSCLLPQFRCLRVLSLSGYQIFELPSSIGDLKHLRYLNLSKTLIRSLPESTSSLYNLQTLILKYCERLTKLPEKIGNLVNLRHLDIEGAHLIKEMPVGIKELKNLQTLSNFVVGKDTASKIGDLMNLESLKGTLCISHLENVLEVEDARRANLLGKKNLNVLVMKWESELDQRASLDILDMLQPSTTMKEISIDGYVGAKFPTWFGHPSFSNMVLLRIERCRKCTSLPAIGQLPSLRDLALVGLSAVEIIGLEFYGEDCPKPFQSLETLCFKDMQEWKDWIPCKVEYEEFPCLRELSISQCPKLQGKLPHHVPLLEKFSINGCEQLDVSIPNFPKLHALEIKGCKGVVSRSTDELCFPKSTILSIPYVKSLTEEFMHGLAKVENLEIDNCKELTSLWQDEFKSLIMLDIRDCSSLVNISLTSTLRTLNITGCSGLKSLSISNCACLEKASILRCNSLTLISRGQLPQNLKTLYISHCENLQFLVDEGEASSNSSSLLEDLVIGGCPSLKCLSSSGDLPTTLKRLKIWSCIELTSFSSKSELPTALKYLYVYNCPKMESIANNLPNNASLEYLQIERCAKLKSLPVGLHKLCHLNKIEIWNCPSFVSIPDGGLLPTSLRELSIYHCEKLMPVWPNCMPNLNSLFILNCPSVIYFPEEGYPTSLTSLSFGGENICKQVTVWGLHRLTSLTSLCIVGGIPDWQSFPDEQDGKLTMTLPSSLTQLRIRSIPNIVILSSLGFQNLSALEELDIRFCPKLASLPEKGLPPSLLRLYIYECPLLKQHCKKGGREWSKIANVPCVLIDNWSVYEVEEEQQ